ncbi:MAG: twin-arginine translocase TatA/TatE family subunit [Pirellulaceae bacterium]|nr:twin-arginine translocase TatA/TatE family subunit [Pirellulaceae bacterium]
MFNLGPTELIFFGVIALMLFGRKLPEVARNLGGSYRELRKHLTDFQREFQGWDRPDPRASSKPAWQAPEPEKIETTAPKFVPPPPPPAEGNSVEE